MKIQINTKAPVQCAKNILINAQPEVVWKILTNINHWSEWQTDITKVVITEEIAPGINFQWKTGGATIHSTLHTVAPKTAFGWTGKTFGLLAVHNWTLTEINGRTQVTVEESMQGF